MIKSETVGKLFKALAIAQAAFGPVLRENENPGYKKDNKPSKYADLNTAIKATQPALIQNGLVVSQFPINTDARVGVLTILGHESGEFIGQEYTLPIFKQDAQTGVAGITYARRAARLAIIDVAAEDDDGNTAAGRKVQDDELPTGTELQNPYGDKPAVVIAQSAKPTQPPKAEIPQSIGSAQSPIKSFVRTDMDKSLPSEVQYEAYVSRLAKLRTKLETDGGLKASRGLPAPHKMLNYIKQVTQTEDLKQISITQFDAFLQYAEKMDPVQLVKLINEVKTGGNTK